MAASFPDDILAALRAGNLSPTIVDRLNHLSEAQLEALNDQRYDDGELLDNDRNPNAWARGSHEALCFAFYNHADRIAELPRTHCGRSYLTVNPSVTLPTAAPLGFDMHEVNLPDLFRSSVSYDIHILIGVTEARHDFHVPSEYDILPTDNLIPVYATIGDTAGGYGPVTLWKIDLLPVNGRLKLGKEQAAHCDIGEVCFLKKYESYGSLEAGSDEWYVGGHFWAHVNGEMEIFMMSE
jgi:hypothetical protein